MNMFFLLIFLGGMGARPERKIGFWSRVIWPVRVAEMLHGMALDYTAARSAQDDDEVVE